MAAPPEVLLAVMQNVVTAMSNIGKTIAGTLSVQVTGTSTSATAGTITFTSSQAVGFLTLVSSTGATIKVPYYS
jgi:hypothetical protein